MINFTIYNDQFYDLGIPTRGCIPVQSARPGAFYTFYAFYAFYAFYTHFTHFTPPLPYPALHMATHTSYIAVRGERGGYSANEGVVNAF